MDLNTTLFALLAALLSLYALLDGFDLGVGVLSLFARSSRERDLHVAAIGPCWDGNEVWLLTAGNVLFGAFPLVFTTAFGGFYMPLMLVLLALVARAVSIEFRRLHPSSRWTRAWDWAFGLGSLVPAVLYGVAVGNVLIGLPVGPGFTWQGSFLDLLGPHALLVGLVSCAFFVLHGALYLRTKTEGELADRMGRIALASHAVFAALAITATAAILRTSTVLLQRASDPRLWVLLLLLAGALAAIPVATLRGHKKLAFTASALTIALAIIAMASSLHPMLLPSSLGRELSLTVYNAASARATLMTVLVVALAGTPIVIGYTIAMYRVFRGPARPVVEAEHEVQGAPGLEHTEASPAPRGLVA
jgi:cytochrome d ubiquinol oxidase subunit II